MAETFKPLNADEIVAVLNAPKNPKYPPPQQFGPVRWYDEEQLCIVSGYRDNEGNWIKTKGKCGSPTYMKVLGIPTCMIHAIRQLNEMLYDKGIDAAS